MWWTEGVWPWLSHWLGTPGFGGAVALVAAAITLSATTRKNRHEIWWEQTEWALGQYVNDAGSDGDSGVAADVLDVLVSSTLATKHEIAFLSAVVSSEALEQRQPDSGTVDKGLLAVDRLVMDNEDSEEERP